MSFKNRYVGCQSRRVGGKKRYFPVRIRSIVGKRRLPFKPFLGICRQTFRKEAVRIGRHDMHDFANDLRAGAATLGARKIMRPRSSRHAKTSAMDGPRLSMIAMSIGSVHAGSRHSQTLSAAAAKRLRNITTRWVHRFGRFRARISPIPFPPTGATPMPGFPSLASWYSLESGRVRCNMAS